MKNLNSRGQHHQAIQIGLLTQLQQYAFQHPRLGHTVKNKIFLSEKLDTRGAEISFTQLEPGETVPFLHQHHQNEEIYIILKGEGQFQIDNQVFDIQEGSVVRVDPNGKRTLGNTSDTPLVYIVIQSLAGSLVGKDIHDGYRCEGEILI